MKKSLDLFVRTGQLLFGLIAAGVTANAQADGFLAARTFPLTGTSPSAAVVQDFNHDGVPDIATANFQSLSVLLAKPQGGFRRAVNYPGGHTHDIATGDLNNDGNPDLAVTDDVKDFLRIYLGAPDGTFVQLSNTHFANQPLGVKVADLNADGKLDIVIGLNDRHGLGQVAILLGKGDGTFQDATFYPSPSASLQLAIVDLNGDGKLDLVVADDRESQVVLGNGDGTFQDAVLSYTAGSDVAAGDLNGDGKVDLVWAGPGGAESLAITLGNGDGTLQGATYYPVAADLVRLADTNGDGALDLVVDGTDVDVLLGNGDGTVGPPTSYGLGGYFVAVGDLNNDSRVDLISGGLDFVSVALGSGDGTFPAAMVSPSGLLVAINTFTTADFDGDGSIDVAMEGSSDGKRITIALGNGKGSFTQRAAFSYIDTGTDLLAADFNNDSKPDLALLAGDNAHVYLGKGDGTFSSEMKSMIKGSAAAGVALDLNGDGIVDLATANTRNESIAVLLGVGDGTFAPAVYYRTGDMPTAIVSADFNSDGKPDLAVSNEGSSSLGIYLGNGDGTFQPAIPTTVTNPSFLTTADFNKDGKPDLAVASTDTEVLLGDGDGTFQPPKSALSATGPLQAGDLDGDGNSDLAVADINSAGPISTALGRGDGTFREEESFYTGGYGPFDLQLADANNDGVLDVITRIYQTKLSVLLGTR